MRVRRIEINYTGLHSYITASVRECGQEVVSVTGHNFEDPIDVRTLALCEWMTIVYQDRLIALALHGTQYLWTWTREGGEQLGDGNVRHPLRDSFLCGTWYPQGSEDDSLPKVILHGACGWESMLKVATALGLTVQEDQAGVDTYEIDDREPYYGLVNGRTGDAPVVIEGAAG